MWLKTVCLIDLSCMCSLLTPLGIWYVSCSSQSTGKIEELLKEDQGVKARRERWQKQAAALSKLTRQLSLHDSQASAGAGLDNSSMFFLLHRTIPFLLFLSLEMQCKKWVGRVCDLKHWVTYYWWNLRDEMCRVFRTYKNNNNNNKWIGGGGLAGSIWGGRNNQVLIFF